MVKGENAVMRHCAVRGDPAPDGDVQIGVRIVQYRRAMAHDQGIDAEAEDQRQGDPELAATGRESCDRRRVSRCHRA
jgi:hypothetical protein